MEESYADAPRAAAGREAPRRRKKKRGITLGGILLGILKLIFTLAIIGVVTAGLFFRTFMHYVNTTLEPEMDVDISTFTLNQSSVIYYQDKASGSWMELQKIHGSENRTLVNYSQIPDHVVKALISIEDERFYEHEGVDWKSTARSVYDTLTGNNARGASTITQQVVKNVTGEKQVTIRRKILEIFRALRVHEKYSEEDILQTYFNLVFFGHNAYGIEAAAETYFGKHVEELTVAEGAAIVGITQNPWKFDPLRNDTTRENNRNRQLDVLYKMNQLGWLSDSDYIIAKTQRMIFVGDDDYVEESQENEDAVDTNEELDSFFVEQVFRDVVSAFMERGYDEKAAALMIYNGGYQIYCTLDPDIQEVVESVYADRGNFNYTSEKGQQLQSGMTIINNQTNNIVAIAGRVGERKGAFEWSYAASASPCGSAIKPLSVYSPAIDAGIISAASVIDDYPVQILNGSPWPVNAYSGYRGLLTIQDALRISSNTTAVRVLERLTPSASFTWMTENLGFTTLDPDDMSAAGALALGGLHKGVSTIEMAAAYATFANNGVYTRPRTFTKVLDSYGNVVIDDKQDSWVAMKETTVYSMNELLKNVLKSGGTGAAANFSGMTLAGKTGTTNSRRDRYFVGYSPYYTGAVWCGYPQPERINSNDNPAAIAWHKVMSRIHEGLEDRDFPTTSDGMTWVTVCNKTGLLAGSGCGGTRRVLVAEGAGPKLTCDAHVGVTFCSEGDAPAGDYCPEETRETRWFIDLSAPNTAAGFGYTRKPIMKGLSDSQYATYAAQVEEGLRSSIPSSVAVSANDSGTLLSDVNDMARCSVHTAAGATEEPEQAEVQEPTPEEPIDTENPDNPINWFENLNPGGGTAEPSKPTQPSTPTQPSQPSEPAQGGGGTATPPAEVPGGSSNSSHPGEGGGNSGAATPPAETTPPAEQPAQEDHSTQDNADYLDWFLNLKEG